MNRRSFLGSLLAIPVLRGRAEAGDRPPPPEDTAWSTLMYGTPIPRPMKKWRRTVSKVDLAPPVRCADGSQLIVLGSWRAENP